MACPSFRPTVCLGVFLQLDPNISLNFGMVLKTLVKLYMTEPDFLGKLFLAQKLEKWAKK